VLPDGKEDFVKALLIRTACVLLGVVAIAGPSLASDGYLRYPDIHGDTVVFTAEADLWTAPASGGSARRLTIHDGTETFPKFSPDGKWIAFTGQYDGNADVYLVMAEGGEPRRLTWHPAADQVVDWTPDGKSVIFRSGRNEPHGNFELFTVPAGGGDAEEMPLGWASRIDIEADTGRWAFNRTQRDTRTWKRYRGGTATTIWVGNPKKADFKEITAFEGMNAFPMWHGGRIYFLSDQGGTANLWSMNPDGADRKRHTDFGNWDARFPSMGPDGRVVFMLAGDIRLFEPGGGTERKITIDLPSDRVLTRSRYPNAGRYLTWLDLSPDGERLAVTARGEVFSVPVEKGVTLPVTRGSGARESYGNFSPDGKRLVYVTDDPREEEIRTIDAWGRGEPEVVRKAGDPAWHYPPEYSPDGKWVAWADQSKTLRVAPSDGGEAKVVDRSEYFGIQDFAWSPDSRWIAYAKASPAFYASVYIYDVEKAEVKQVTSDHTSDYSPAWDPKGRYLYFLSDRTTNPLVGFNDLENVGIKPTKPYVMLLRADVDNPFAHLAGKPPVEGEEDEDKEADEKKKKEKKGEENGDDEKKDDEKKPEPVEIEFDGLAERVAAFPVEAGNYGGLGATKAKVFYFSVPIQGMAEGPGLFEEAQPIASLMAFDLEKKKADPFMQGISGYEIALKADKIAIMKNRGEIYVVGTAAPPGKDLAESKVALDGVVIELDPHEEWAQIYYEAWRHMREFYWDAGMGGVDWDRIRDHYATLLPRLATRDDLRDLIGEMIGELSTSHTYVFGGDPGIRVRGVSVGMLGADLVRDGDAFRVETIYHGAPADDERSPLREPGVGIQEGEFILAVNHRGFAKDRPFYAAMEGLGGKEVLLTVNDTNSTDGAREVVVVPLRGEGGVRYADWVRRNREYVAEKTGGKIAYIHVPDMMGPGLVEFNTWFYPQLDKDGMVVDMRWNGGGFVSQMLVQRFMRRIISWDRTRGGEVMTYPFRVLNGPFVVLTNQFAGSDGDIFPAAIQLAGLAPIIGKRSWGGVVGINNLRPMVDGGLLTQPAAAWWDAKSGWGLENRGVEPDIEVENLPQELATGVDAQLDRGIQEVMRLHAETPPLAPDFGPVRPRDRNAYEKELGN
jgi:tricorn protease